MIIFKKDGYTFCLAEKTEQKETIKLVCDVYREHKYIAQNITLEDEYDKNAVSVIAKKDGTIVGTIRIIYPVDNHSLYVENDFNIKDGFFERIRGVTVEISRLAIEKEHRQPIVYLGMFRILLEISKEYDYWVAVMREGLLRRLSMDFAFDYQEIPILEPEPSHQIVREKLPGYYKKKVRPFLFQTSSVRNALKTVYFESPR